MLKIGIYDNEVHHIKYITELLIQYTMQTNRDDTFICFSSAKQLLDSTFDYNVLLLDILLEDELNGLDVAIKLRRKGYLDEIILITSEKDFLQKGYEIDCFRYLLKPVEPAKLFKALNDVVKKFDSRRHFRKEKIKVISDKEEIFIDVLDIIKIVGDKKNQVIHTEREEIIVKDSMKNLFAKLPQSYFIFTHESFIVNMSFIKRYTTTDIILMNNCLIPIARTRYKLFKQTVSNFIEDVCL